MAERIGRTPIKEALRVLGFGWDDANNRLRAMEPADVLARMPGAVWYNSSHPFRDRLHIEGMMEGLKFALTGHSEAVEFFLGKVPDRESVSSEPPTSQRLSRLEKKLLAFDIFVRYGQLGFRGNLALFAGLFFPEWLKPKRLKG